MRDSGHGTARELYCRSPERSSDAFLDAGARAGYALHPYPARWSECANLDEENGEDNQGA